MAEGSPLLSGKIETNSKNQASTVITRRPQESLWINWFSGFLCSKISFDFSLEKLEIWINSQTQRRTTEAIRSLRGDSVEPRWIRSLVLARTCSPSIHSSLLVNYYKSVVRVQAGWTRQWQRWKLIFVFSGINYRLAWQIANDLSDVSEWLEAGSIV